jgi:hypothetical protein
MPALRGWTAPMNDPISTDALAKLFGVTLRTITDLTKGVASSRAEGG